MARPISRWVPFEFADTHPLFPICRPPFPPHMSEIDSLFSFFHLEVAFFNESIDAKLNRHAKSRLWARTPTPLLTSGVLPKAGYSGVVVPDKVRTVYNASMIAARPLKSQQQERLMFLSFPISRTPIPAISQKDGFLRWRCWWSSTRESPRASPRRCSSSNGVSRCVFFSHTTCVPQYATHSSPCIYHPIYIITLYTITTYIDQPIYRSPHIYITPHI